MVAYKRRIVPVAALMNIVVVPWSSERLIQTPRSRAFCSALARAASGSASQIAAFTMFFNCCDVTESMMPATLRSTIAAASTDSGRHSVAIKRAFQAVAALAITAAQVRGWRCRRDSA